MPGMLHGTVLPLPHARLRGVEFDTYSPGKRRLDRGPLHLRPSFYWSSQRSMFQVIRPVVRYGTTGLTFLTADR